MAGFASAFRKLAHGALNWDTQLDADLGALEAFTDQGSFTPSYFDGGAQTNGNGGSQDGFYALLGKRATLHGRITFGSGGNHGNGIIFGLNTYGKFVPAYSMGYGWYEPTGGGAPKSLILRSRDADSAFVLVDGGSSLQSIGALGSPAVGDQIHFVFDAALQ